MFDCNMKMLRVEGRSRQVFSLLLAPDGSFIMNQKRIAPLILVCPQLLSFISFIENEM